VGGVSRRVSRQQASLRRERERRRTRDQRRDDRSLAAELAARAGLAVAPTGPPPTRADVPGAVDMGVGAGADADAAAEALASGRRVAGQQLACGWCAQPLIVRPTGRMPKWCSAACRHRAWEQNRAAASGRAAVEVVDRYVAAVPADGPGWITQLGQLTRQIAHDSGEIPSSDLGQLAASLELAQAAIADRTRWAGGANHDRC